MPTIHPVLTPSQRRGPSRLYYERLTWRPFSQFRTHRDQFVWAHVRALFGAPGYAPVLLERLATVGKDTRTAVLTTVPHVLTLSDAPQYIDPVVHHDNIFCDWSTYLKVTRYRKAAAASDGLFRAEVAAATLLTQPDSNGHRTLEFVGVESTRRWVATAGVHVVGFRDPDAR